MSSQTHVSKTQKLQRVGSKILQKIFRSKAKIDLVELGSTEVKAARTVTFIPPTETPRIIDLKSMRRSIHPQPTRSNIHHSLVGTPMRKNSQQAYVSEETSRHPAAAILDDVEDHEDYQRIHEEESDVDWSLLDLPENVYARLANESRHSLL